MYIYIYIYVYIYIYIYEHTHTHRIIGYSAPSHECEQMFLCDILEL